MSTIMYNMLCSIHFVHSANLIHRDIKPSNFLMNFDCIPKLCDFGLARSMPKNIPDYTVGSTSTKDTDSENLLSLGSTAGTTVTDIKKRGRSKVRQSSFQVPSIGGDTLKLPVITERKALHSNQRLTKSIQKTDSFIVSDFGQGNKQEQEHARRKKI